MVLNVVGAAEGACSKDISFGDKLILRFENNKDKNPVPNDQSQELRIEHSVKKEIHGYLLSFPNIWRVTVPIIQIKYRTQHPVW
jgi:hypothetical protein